MLHTRMRMHCFLRSIPREQEMPVILILSLIPSPIRWQGYSGTFSSGEQSFLVVVLAEILDESWGSCLCAQGGGMGAGPFMPTSLPPSHHSFPGLISNSPGASSPGAAALQDALSRLIRAAGGSTSSPTGGLDAQVGKGRSLQGWILRQREGAACKDGSLGRERAQLARVDLQVGRGQSVQGWVFRCSLKWSGIGCARGSRRAAHFRAACGTLSSHSHPSCL